MGEIFQNQVALVTGAGVGIGLEIARQLARHGAAVLLNDVDPTLAEQAAASIRREGGRCQGVGGDVGEIEVVRSLVTQAVQTFGHLSLVVANAGLTLWGSFLDYRPEDFQRVLDVNLRGTFFLAQAAARQMREQGNGGRILLISSVTGHQAVPYLAAYGMSKAALEMLARTLVIELAPLGITVNALAPGATVTPRNLADDPDYEQVWGSLIPTGRAAYPEDIASAALFLLSPAASQITGQSLVVDGGWSAISPTPPLDFVQEREA